MAQTFSKVYGVPNIYDSPLGIQITKDNGFIAGGNYMTTSSNAYFLMKLDSNGGEEWYNILKYKSAGGEIRDSTYVRAIGITKDGGYLIGGGAEDNYYRARYIVKTDALGKVLWSKSYGGKVIKSIDLMLENPDSSIMCVSRMFSENATCLTKINAKGDPLWTTKYGDTVTFKYNMRVYSIYRLKDSGYLMTGYTTNNVHFNNDVLLIRTDNKGKEIWEKSYGSFDSTDYQEQGLSCIQTTDGNYMVCGSSSFHGNAYFLKIKPNGDTLWTKRYKFGKAASTAYNILEMPNRDLVAIIESADYTYHYLVKLSSGGNIKWVHPYTLGYGIAVSVAGMGVTKGGGFFFGGQYNGLINPKLYNSYLIKTDSGGSAPDTVYAVNTTTAVQLVNYNIIDCRVYPNPASNVIFADFSLNEKEHVTITIADLQGRIVYANDLGIRSSGSVHEKLDVQNLKSGIYLLNIQTSSGFYKGKIVVER